MDVWITRNRGSSGQEGEDVAIWDKKPEKRILKRKCFSKLGGIEFFNPISYHRTWKVMTISEFKKSFGFIPRKGTCQEFDIVLKRGR